MARTRVVPNAGFVRQIEAMLDRRLGRVVRELAALSSANLTTPHPPSSEPYNPPHRRTGGLQASVTFGRIGVCDWYYGYAAVGPNPARPGADRSNLGIWMELGTGQYRHAPTGSGGIAPNPSGGLTSVQPRPNLLPVLVTSGPVVAAKHFG